MKKFFLAFVFITSIVQAQYKIVGTLLPVENQKRALLYKIEGAKQHYIGNTEIENGSFVFSLDKAKKPGVYRVAYDLKKNLFIDVFFNKEDVIFTFDPSNPEGTKTFSISDENKLYGKYLQAISYIQHEIDSLQVDYLKNPKPETASRYKSAVQSINNVQTKYVGSSKTKLIHDFINATDRFNAPEIAKTPNDYLNGIKTHFFDNIDFNNQTLYNSPFLVDRITDYIFYINYSDDINAQNKLYQEATSKVINKIKNITFKKDIISYLISQFTIKGNVVLVDYIFENYFDKLPKEHQDLEFKENTLLQLTTVIGRIAPDFSWKENGKTIQLSQLKDGKNYVLIFYSTTCSHCTYEIPKVYEFLKEKVNTKVIAYALEDNEMEWKNYKKTLNGWHHVLGMDKWENTIARTYNIVLTPTYFVLDADKKIIAKPDHLEDIKRLFK